MRRVLFVLVVSLLALPFLLAAAGCDNPRPTASPNALDRPEALAFFCWNLTTAAAAPLSACAPVAPAAGEEDVGEPAEGFALHALVAQTASGEVAAIRMTGRNGEAGVIDSDVRLPGFTFAPVGEVPSAVVVSERSPEFVYVVSRGSNDVRVITVADFRAGVGTPVTTFDDILPVGSRASDMLLTPDESALLIALPESGAIARVPIMAGGGLGTAELLMLDSTVPPPVDLTALTAAEQPPEYRYVCELAGVVTRDAIAPRTPPPDTGLAPKPWDLLLDPVTGELLVADRALPIIHVIDPVAFTEGTPLSVSVPTRELAITPRVPATAADITPSERFVYAIDDFDQSVMAIEYSDPARPSFGAVLTVNVGAAADRLAIPFQARTIEVLHPAYSDSDGDVELCTDARNGEVANGIDLNGVFLAVGTIDGRVRFFDIFDLDAPCRGTTCATGANPSSVDEFVAIGRHRPRIGTSSLSDSIAVSPDPSWDSDGVGAATVGRTGDTSLAERVPNMTALASCPSPLEQVYPVGNDTSPLICGIRDPWAALSERYIIEYNGPVPFTSTGGNFQETGAVLETRTNYCSLGVIGSDDPDPPSTGYLAGYGGDVLVITSDLPRSILDSADDMLRADCELLISRMTSGMFTQIEIPIKNAFVQSTGTYAGRLELDEDNITPEGVTMDEIRRCYPELLEVQVRVNNAFVVRSSITGFSHPIVADATDGRCVVDPAAAMSQRGRAFFNDTFAIDTIAFAFGDRPSEISRPVLEFLISNVPPPLNVDVSSIGGTSGPSLLSGLVYNNVDERLYAVDQAVQGLLRMRLTPSLTVQQSFR